MTVPFVHSRFERVDGDFYPTIDPRCTYGFLEHFKPSWLCVDVCAPDGSGIVDTLAACGVLAEGRPDAFADGITAEWIVTNTPYTRADRVLVDRIINRQIRRVSEGDVEGIACLLRSNFDFAKSRRAMFRDNPLYYGQIKLLFRPWWSENREAQPIHNYVWHIWKKHTGAQVVLYADGVKP